jgi:glycosyltransferase involved in cell wall biosynthesis
MNNSVADPSGDRGYGTDLKPSRLPSVVYGTNMWSHHQAPVAGELAQQLGPDRFYMALFEDVSAERRRLGWSGKIEGAWVIGPPQSVKDQEDILQKCVDADVMIWGDCPAKVLQKRVAAGKLTLVAAERLLKKPFHRLRMLNPRYALGLARYRAMVNHPNVHSLSVGRYAPRDLRTIGAFGERVWRWGYFAAVSAEPPNPRAAGLIKILWVGRLIDWKRVDTLIQAIARICRLPWFGGCMIVGEGPEKRRLQRLARRLGLSSEKLQFMPPVAFDKVRSLMQNADVYVLPSNRMEGWGVALNEAMAEGCVVVANEQAGASRELIEDGVTGFLFRDGDARQLAALLDRLGNDPVLRMRLSRQAWEKMYGLWHPRVAAERLLMLASGLMGLSVIPEFDGGPCARVNSANHDH